MMLVVVKIKKYRPKGDVVCGRKVKNGKTGKKSDNKMYIWWRKTAPLATLSQKGARYFTR